MADVGAPSSCSYRSFPTDQLCTPARLCMFDFRYGDIYQLPISRSLKSICCRLSPGDIICWRSTPRHIHNPIITVTAVAKVLHTSFLTDSTTLTGWIPYSMSHRLIWWSNGQLNIIAWVSLVRPVFMVSIMVILPYYPWLIIFVNPYR